MLLAVLARELELRGVGVRRVLFKGADMAWSSDFGLGTLVSNASELWGTGKARKDADDERARNAQDRQILVDRARIGPDLMARVEAFKAAGFHPAMAIGGFGSFQGPVVSSSSATPPGPQFRFSSDVKSPEIHPDDARRRKAEADLVEVNVALAQRRLATQPGNASVPADVVVNAYQDQGVGLESHPFYSNAVKLKPDEMTSRSSIQVGETAGIDHPGMRQFQLPGGFRMLLPDTGSGGMPEDVEVSLLPAVIGANVDRYGARWLGDYLRYMMGTTPGDPGWLGRAMDAIDGMNFRLDRAHGRSGK